MPKKDKDSLEPKHSKKVAKSKSEEKSKKRDKKVEDRPRKLSNTSAESDSKSTDARPKKSDLRAKSKQEWKDNMNKEKAYLEEKYDINLRDSDDSSDEENLLRTGNVPKKWYDLYDHKGYSVDGKTVEKMVEKDELQKFVEKSEDPQWWRNITDDLNNKEIRLSRADLEMLIRIRKGKVADKNF